MQQSYTAFKWKRILPRPGQRGQYSLRRFTVNPNNEGAKYAMSWDIHYSSPNRSMGTKEHVCEQFLTACEQIIGSAISRRGPTEIDIAPSFRYETLFVGAKHAVESFVLVFEITNDLPQDVNHPALAFARQIAVHTGWHAVDSTTELPLKKSG